MIVVRHDDDYFVRTPPHKQRICCNCKHRFTHLNKCDIDEHYIAYAECLTCWCRHWAMDKERWAKCAFGKG